MSRLLLRQGVPLVLVYAAWFALIYAGDHFSGGHWLSIECIGSYLGGWALVLGCAWLSGEVHRYRFAIVGGVLALIALLTWWRTTGHTGSILPFLDGSTMSAGLFAGWLITLNGWWSQGQSVRDVSGS